MLRDGKYLDPWTIQSLSALKDLKVRLILKALNAANVEYDLPGLGKLLGDISMQEVYDIALRSGGKKGIRWKLLRVCKKLRSVLGS